MIYLVRHGQTDWNSAGRIQGREDIELNADGIAQAQALMQTLKNIPLDAVVSSPLKRARKTAELSATDHGLKVITDDDLIERDFGELSGASYAERDNREKLFKDSPVPGMEDMETLRNRVISVISKYAHSEYKNVLMVSHGAAIKSVLRVLTSDDLSRDKVWLKNSCINLIDLDESGNLKLLAYNLDNAEFLNFIMQK